ncbi:MAG: hypothetical protein ACREQW_04950 [Candidatus Binatia bacterium]
MADITDLEKKRLEQQKKKVLDIILTDKDPNIDVIYLDPYLILYVKDERKITVTRLEEEGIMKIFEDKPTN